MTRDFLIEFADEQQAQVGHNILATTTVGEDRLPLFGQIDNRGKTLFVTLTYPREITASTFYSCGDHKAPLPPEVSFVAIKNGMHQEEGFAFFTPGIADSAPEEGAHVAQLGETVLHHFDLNNQHVSR
jgi:hypothetical protein